MQITNSLPNNKSQHVSSQSPKKERKGLKHITQITDNINKLREEMNNLKRTKIVINNQNRVKSVNIVSKKTIETLQAINSRL